MLGPNNNYQFLIMGLPPPFPRWQVIVHLQNFYPHSKDYENVIQGKGGIMLNGKNP
jgi:hypothetical protein